MVAEGASEMGGRTLEETTVGEGTISKCEMNSSAETKGRYLRQRLRWTPFHLHDEQDGERLGDGVYPVVVLGHGILERAWKKGARMPQRQMRDAWECQLTAE